MPTNNNKKYVYVREFNKNAVNKYSALFILLAITEGGLIYLMSTRRLTTPHEQIHTYRLLK